MGRGAKRNEPRNDRDDGGSNDDDEQPRIHTYVQVSHPDPRSPPVPSGPRSLDEGEDLPSSNVFALS